MMLALFLAIMAAACIAVAILYWVIGALPRKRVRRNDDSPHDMFFNPVRDEIRDLKNKLDI